MISQKQIPVLVAAVASFGIPVLIAVMLNWEQIRPYVIVDPGSARGHVLYLYAPS